MFEDSYHEPHEKDKNFLEMYGIPQLGCCGIPIVYIITDIP